MKLNNLVMRGGVLVVLLSLLVVGCKGMSSGDEDVTKEGTKHIEWDKSNPSTTEYLRMGEQFGSSQKVTEAKIKVVTSSPQNGKAGILFGMTDQTVEKNKTWNYYVLGIGQKISDSSKLEYYIDRYTGVKAEDLSKSDQSEGPTTGNKVEIQAMTDVNMTTWTGYQPGKELTVFFDISYDEETKKYTIKFGQSETLLTETVTVTHTDSTTAGQGGIGAYGMLSKAVAEGSPKTTKNVYDVVSSKPTVLAAEDAE